MKPHVVVHYSHPLVEAAKHLKVCIDPLLEMDPG